MSKHQCEQIANRLTVEATRRLAASVQGDVAQNELRVVVFNPLGEAQLVQIAELRLADLRKLLADRIKVADFVAELISGAHINAHVHAWAAPREAALWQEFRAVMHGTDLSGWLYDSASGLPLLTISIILPAFMLAGSLSLREIVLNQSGYWWGFIPKWYLFLQPLGFLIYMIAGVAETNRAPFDFPEAEQELVAGYHTEYSSMSFALFFLAEYVNMATVSAVAVSLFLGGWHGPFLPEWLGWIWFLIKVFALLFFYIWMRWTLPRYRYDQLMEFGWKYLLPIATINLLVTAALTIYMGW